jgi:hypothetical protein
MTQQMLLDLYPDGSHDGEITSAYDDPKMAAI